MNFGKPIYAQEFVQAANKEITEMTTEERFEFVADMAGSIMQAIKEVVPVLPVPLMSAVVLAQQDKWSSELELKSKAVAQMNQLKEKGAPIDISEAACERVLSAALDMLHGRGFIEMQNNLYQASKASIGLLEYYANSINYWE